MDNVLFIYIFFCNKDREIFSKIKKFSLKIFIHNLKFKNMSEYSTTNITQSVLPSDDKKYPLKENSTIN